MLKNGAPRIAGVYAISFGSSVYVGESVDVLRRNTYRLAELLSMPYGIVSEMPGSTREQRMREEARVASVFRRRGFAVCGPKGPITEETRERMSAAQKGRPKLGQRGCVRSPEVRARMSAGLRASWLRRKEQGGNVLRSDECERQEPAAA